MEGVEGHADFKDLHEKRLAAHTTGVGHSRYSTDLEDTETMVRKIKIKRIMFP
jgi:hypothetical protein